MLEKILLAEDDPSIIRFMEIYIKRRYEVEVDKVSDGESAIDHVMNYSYTAILLDNNMPILNGLDAIPIIREKYPEIPIIMLSANYIEEEAIELGASHFILKSSIINELYPILDQYLTLHP